MESSGRGGAKLSIQFCKVADRFAHSIFFETTDGPLELLRSLEGNAEDNWPVSPPLQQLLDEVHDDGPVALAVGMAGKSHWSLSAQALADGVIAFDVACRVTKVPDRLGSLYTVVHPQNTDRGWEISGARVEVTRVDCQTAFSPQGLSCSPTLNDQLPQTYRWRYEVRIA